MNQFDTLVFYWGLLIVTFVCGCLSQSKCIDSHTREYKIRFKLSWFLLTYALVLFFTIATEVGADFIPYSRGYRLVTWDNHANINSEPGYRVVMLLLKKFISNPNLGVQTIKGITVSIVYVVFFRHRYEIHMGLATLAYMSLAFCDSLNLISMHLASALVLLGVSCLVKKQTKTAIIITVLAGTIHYSTFLALASILITVFLIKKGKLSKWKSIAILAVVILIVPNIARIVQVFISRVSFLQKYNVYNFRENNASGLMIIFYLVPVIYYVVQCLIKNPKDRWGIIGVALVVMSYTVANASYYFVMVGRAQTIVWFLYFLFLPYEANQARLENTCRKSKNSICKLLNSYQVILLLLVCYFGLRFVLYTTVGNLLPAKVDQYSFWF